MLDPIWDFFKSNWEAVSALGTGVVTICGGLWAIFKHRAATKDKANVKPYEVRADRGSVAFGGDVTNSPITINNSSRSKSSRSKR